MTERGKESFGPVYTQETDALVERARSLINEQFKALRNISNQPTLSRTPSCSSATSTNSNVISRPESVKDARKKLKKEWQKLKDNSQLSDDSLENQVELRRRQEAEGQILLGVVAYFEIPNKKQIDRLKSLLLSMGASVSATFSKEVTHIIFKNGSLLSYKRAKLLNVHLVSVLWVEACKNSKTKLSEKLFPVLNKNEYSNSPRIFRKFMECQSDNFEYDPNSDTIIRKPKKQPTSDRLETPTEPNDVELHEREEISPNNSVSSSPTLQHLNISSDKSFESNASDAIPLHEKPKDSVIGNDVEENVTNKPNSPTGLVNIEPHESDERRIENSPGDLDATLSTLYLHFSSDKSSESNGNGSISPREDNTRDSVNDDVEEDNDTNKKKSDKEKTPAKRKLFPTRPMQGSYFSSDASDSSQTNKGGLNIYEKKYRNKTQNSQKTKDLPTTKKRDENNKNNKPFIPATVLTPPMKKSNQNKPTLVTTYFHSNENKHLRNVIKKLGVFAFKTYVDDCTTHVVVGEPERTVNLLKGVARGCWILDKKWIQESDDAGHWLAEENYELISFSSIVQRSRLQKQAFGKNYTLNIFDDCGPIFISESCQTPFNDLFELVKLCGGKTTFTLNVAKIIIGEAVDEKVCVTDKWIFDCITYGRYKSTSKYLINNL